MGEEGDLTGAAQGIPNINIGVLGHVDSGKTSLVRVLSTLYSTASLDKNPQSKERGITLDLGFSAFTVPTPSHLADIHSDFLQFTLVDCPGHASLIKTIIGGAQIIDRMLLVIDVTKGIQTQTAECLVIGEILTDNLLVVLNKTDLIQGPDKDAKLEKVTTAVQQALKTTRFKTAPIISVAARIGGDGKAGVGESSSVEVAPAIDKTAGIDKLVELILKTTTIPQRNQVDKHPLYMSIDHCFSIKGQGTILTGTVLSGKVTVGDTVEVVGVANDRKVKSIQMFRQNTASASQGDRAALCVTNLNAKLVERGIVATVGSVQAIHGAISLVRKVKYFQRDCVSGSKMHITIGHATVLCTVVFFGSEELRGLAKSCVGKHIATTDFDETKDWQYDEQLRSGGKSVGGPILQWAFLRFDNPARCQDTSVVIGSRLDLDVNSKECRIAFHGKIVRSLKEKELEDLSFMRVYKTKERIGNVDRLLDKGSEIQNVIAKNILGVKSDIQQLVGLKVLTSSGEEGKIESTFGKTGKVKVYFPSALKQPIKKGDKLVLPLRKYVFAVQEERKKLLQE